MTPQKRKADAQPPAEPSGESPSKRARSESPVDKANGNPHFSDEPQDHTDFSIPTAEASIRPAPVESEIGFPENIPETWDQASAADKLLVEIKKGNPKNKWDAIEQKWEKKTGEKPAKDVLKDRWSRLIELRKNFVLRPESVRAKASSSPMKYSTGNGASDRVVSQRAKSALKAPRKRKAEAEPSEESSDGSSDSSSSGSSYGTSKHSINVARREPRSAVERRMKADASDGPSDDRIGERKKAKPRQASDKEMNSAYFSESAEPSKNSHMGTEPAQRPRAKNAVAKNSEDQVMIETALEMLVDMRDGGCGWDEIAKAWTERTGFTHAAGTLRNRVNEFKKGFAKEPKPTSQPSLKRKSKATSIDEDAYDLSAKRLKSSPKNPSDTETPMKRNMDRGKRKSSVKYVESTTDEDEDEAFAAPTEPTHAGPARRNAGRPAKVDRSDPEWLVTNEKSPLANEDLHAEYSNPKTYENFTKEDWEELRETLPPNVPTNPDGYSIPMTFFKYDPDFRRGIREFQEDLALGRLDPKWQADAAQAMEERARGEFDTYKENQFEAFWGQKQKLHHDALAGESSKIKLELLIQHGVFKVGDIFSYSRVFGRGKTGVLVEKDCKIVTIGEKDLTFAIPPGQRKYSRRMFEAATRKDNGPEAKVQLADGDKSLPTSIDSGSNAAEGGVTTEASGDGGPRVNEQNGGVLASGDTAKNGRSQVIQSKGHETLLDRRTEADRKREPEQFEDNEVKASDNLQEDEIPEPTSSEENKENGATAQINGGDKSAAAPGDEDILHNISLSLPQLEHKILEVDGRFQPKDVSAANAWKNIRNISNNQDLGTLFEIREEFYVLKHPQIVKQPRAKR